MICITRKNGTKVDMVVCLKMFRKQSVLQHFRKELLWMQCGGVRVLPARSPAIFFHICSKTNCFSNILHDFWSALGGRTYGPTVGAVNAESPKRNVSKTPKKKYGHEIGVFPTDLHYILHERSCNNFQGFPHTPMPHRPLKRPKN